MKDKDSKDLKGTHLISLEELEASISDEARYIDREKIGKGGQATVYKVYDKKLKVNRAMKVLNPEFSEDVDFIEDFIREIRLTAELNSPNIVKVYDADFINDELFMVMDYIEGNTAGNFGKIPKPISVAIAIRAAQALEYAHSRAIDVEGYRQQGVIHRDIKPDNLMIGKDGEVKVMDFGLSKTMESKSSATTGNIQGSLMYMSPEQFDKKVSSKSDIYSLGVTLHEMITGKTGYEGMSTAQIFKAKSSGDYHTLIDHNEIDPELEKIIRKATERNPAKRYNNISEMLDELNNYLNSHYTIDSDLARVVGAFINFKILPAEKQPPPPIGGKGFLKFIPYFLIIILIIFGVLNWDTIRDLFKQSVPDKKEYKLTIKNEDNLEAKVHIDGTIYEMDKKDAKITLNEKKTYDITIKSDGVDDYKIEAVIDDDKNIEIYDPPEYTIHFSYENFARDFNVKIGGNSRTELKNIKNSKFTTRKSGSYRVLVTDPSGKYSNMDRTINLGRDNSSYAMQVNPPLKARYKVTISNPKNINARISDSGSSEENLTGYYQKTYKTSKKRTYTVKAEDYEDWTYTADFSKKEVHEVTYSPKKIEKKKVEVVKPSIPPEPGKEYTVTITNPQTLDAYVEVDGRREFIASEKTLIFDTKGKKTLTVTAKDYETKTYTPDFNIKESYIYDYDPIFEGDDDEDKEYQLTIMNPQEIEAQVIVDGESSRLGMSLIKTYTKKVKKTLKVTAEGYYDQEFTADFSKKDKYSFSYNPSIKYSVTIFNDQGIPAKLSIDGMEPVTLDSPHIDDTKIPGVRTYLIMAEGYQDTLYSVDFAEKQHFDIYYNPVAKPLVLIIENTPENGAVFVDGMEVCKTKEGETEIEGVNVVLGSEHNVKVEVKSYEVWEKEFKMDSFETRLVYEGIKITGKVLITPQLDELLANQTSLFVDGESVAFTQTLEGLDIGSHTIDIIFKVGQYQDKLSETFRFTESDRAKEWKLNIDQVKIVSTQEGADITIEGTPVGRSPITIPFINKTLVMATAESGDFGKIEETIKPKEYSGRNFVFRFPADPKAEDAYFEAVDLMDEYDETESSSNLTNAKIKLKEALKLYKGYPEALQLYFELMAKQTELGANTGDSSKLNKYYDEARSLYLENKDTFLDESTHGWCLGYFITCNYYYSSMLNGDEAKRYHLQEVIDSYHEDYKKLRTERKAANNEEKLERDRLDCNWSRVCHNLWKILNETNAEESEITKAGKRAKAAWNSNFYSPYDNHPNPYKSIKMKNYAEVMNY